MFPIVAEPTYILNNTVRGVETFFNRNHTMSHTFSQDKEHFKFHLVVSQFLQRRKEKRYALDRKCLQNKQVPLGELGYLLINKVS